MSDWSEHVVEGSAARLEGVELRHLAALRAIADEGSFRGAADRLGYVQSAVSHQIAALERLVGARLVERQRGNMPVSMTPAGELLLKHADEILAELGAAQEKLFALAEGRAGILRVGAFQSAAANVLPRFLSAFSSACPEYRVVPSETQSDLPLLELLDEDDLDLAFAEAPYDVERFDGVELLDDPYVLLVADDSPLAQSDAPPSYGQLSRLPLIGFNSSRAQDNMLETLRAHGSDPRFTFKSDLQATLQAMVAAGLGVAIVPYLTIDPTHAGTSVIELPDVPPRRISLVWSRRRERSLAASRFVQIGRTTCPRFRRGRADAAVVQRQAA